MTESKGVYIGYNPIYGKIKVGKSDRNLQQRINCQYFSKGYIFCVKNKKEMSGLEAEIHLKLENFKSKERIYDKDSHKAEEYFDININNAKKECEKILRKNGIKYNIERFYNKKKEDLNEKYLNSYSLYIIKVMNFHPENVFKIGICRDFIRRSEDLIRNGYKIGDSYCLLNIPKHILRPLEQTLLSKFTKYNTSLLSVGKTELIKEKDMKTLLEKVHKILDSKKLEFLIEKKEPYIRKFKKYNRDSTNRKEKISKIDFFKNVIGIDRSYGVDNLSLKEMSSFIKKCGKKDGIDYNLVEKDGTLFLKCGVYHHRIIFAEDLHLRGFWLQPFEFFVEPEFLKGYYISNKIKCCNEEGKFKNYSNIISNKSFDLFKVCSNTPQFARVNLLIGDEISSSNIRVKSVIFNTFIKGCCFIKIHEKKKHYIVIENPKKNIFTTDIGLKDKDNFNLSVENILLNQNFPL